ncbi:MAG: type IX secretion system plug protein domain-containing protein [Rhodothermales bacterium]
MSETYRRATALFFFLFAAFGAGCAGPKESGTGPRSTIPSPQYVELDLAATSGSIRSIQLYRTPAEEALPVVEANSDQTLTLEFDLMAEQGRPLSAYFYHADRVWRRDITAGEFLESFQHDNLLDYSISSGTQVPYVHYEYSFPNNNIRFLVSGNYVIRVTAQGDEEDVLFERAFFLTEQAASLEFMTDRVIVGNYGYPSIQPIALVRPPPGTEGNLFDYNVCFVRNGRLDMARCSDRPSLLNAPMMEFYLEPEVSFEPEGAAYFVDLANLRASPSISAADFTQSPYRVYLEPDFARFGGSGLAPLLNGQSVISSAVRLGEPDIEAEFVLTRFAYVPPDEQRLDGEVILTGSFNGWQYDPANRLTWMPDEGRYEGDVLLKQGQYEYRYVTQDRSTLRALRGNLPRPDNQYAAFVYYRDVSLNTDRLLAVRQAISD